MNDIQEDLDVIGRLATDLKSQLGSIDQSFTDSSSGRKNRALQLDPRKLFQEITGRKIKIDKAQQLIDERNIRLTEKSVEFVPPTQINDNYQPPPDPSIKWSPNELIKDNGTSPPKSNPSNQLELDLDIPTKKQETYNNLYELADLIKRRMDKLDNDLAIIRNMVKEIKINTTKRIKKIM